VIVTRELPQDALSRKDLERGAYTDCYTTDVALQVPHAQYVEAFYTSWAFKLERFVLKWLVAKPSTDEEARRLSRGELDNFAAWTVEQRAPDQVLLADFMGKTKSWLMVAPLSEGQTRLYFGSVVNPVPRPTHRPSTGRTFGAMLAFHKRYSRVLLGAAAAKITRSGARESSRTGQQPN
jgi:hypothetical protein